jgi:hypothetical protein
MGQGLLKNHKKYRSDFCSANHCKKCLIVEINFLLQECRLHLVYGSLSVNFNQGSLLYEFQKNYVFHIFAQSTRNSKRDFNHCGFSKAAFLKTVVYYKQDFFRQNQFAPCAGTRATTLKILTIFYSRIFLVGSQTSSPPFSIFMNFFVEIYTLFPAASLLSIFFNT